MTRVTDEEVQRYFLQPQKPYSEEEIKKRRDKIILIRENLKMQGKFPDEFKILNELKKFGYFVDTSELRDDIKEIDKNSNFILDLARWGYNGMAEDMFDRITMINRGCDEIIAKKWTKSSVSITEENSNGTILKKKKVITNELAGPKIEAANIQTMITKVYTEILKGGIIDTAVAIFAKDANKLSQDYRKSMQELYELTQEVENKNKIISKLKEPKNDNSP